MIAIHVDEDAVGVAGEPPTAKGRITRRRIMDAATALFAQRSYATVRITDITEAAGLSPGAFYRYFTDRRALMLELLRDLTDEAFDFIRSPMDSRQPIVSVLDSTRKYFEFYRRHRALFGLLVELAQTDVDVAHIWEDTRTAVYARISRSLRRGMESGSIRPDLDSDLAATMLGSMTEFYAFQRLVLDASPASTSDLDAAAQMIAEIWVSGVSTPRG